MHRVLLGMESWTYCLTVVFLLTLTWPWSRGFDIDPVTNRTTMKVGFISPTAGIFGYRNTASATTIAVRRAHEAGILTELDVAILWRNGACNGKTALGVTVTFQNEDHVDAYIGLPCSEAAINAGKIIAYWNLPHTSYSSPDPVLADRVTYDTLIRTISPFNNLAKGLVTVFQKQKWDRAVIMVGYDKDNYCDYAIRSISGEFVENNIYVAETMGSYSNKNYTDEELNRWMSLTKEQGRIVVICFELPLVRRIMLLAQQHGMCEGDYVFFYPTLLPATNFQSLWRDPDESDAYNEAARVAFIPLLQITLSFGQDNTGTEFLWTDVPRELALPPWNSSYLLETGEPGSVYALYLHDSVFLYMMALDEIYRMYGDRSDQLRNGSLIFHISKNKTFQGMSGEVVIDSNGDRIGEYGVYQLVSQGEGYDYQEWAHIKVAYHESGDEFSISSPRNWGSAYGNDAPPSTPICGFLHELCPSDTSARDNVIVAASVSTIVLCAAVGFGFLIYRRKVFEGDLELMLWKVRYEDVIIVNQKINSSLGSRRLSLASGGGDTQSSHMPSGAGGLIIGQVKGILAVVKRLNKSGITLTREDQLELKSMKDLNHDNINPFVGMCVEIPDVCILTKYCSKGSLMDVLDNEAFNLDMVFKSSFIADLINGLEYLHKSPLKSHGRLKSSNCLLDGRWVIKITDYGLGPFREDTMEGKDIYKAMLWTSPELLRDNSAHRNGTQKGDVYSFAIVLQEIIYRCGPYEATGQLPMVPKDLCGRIRNGETPPFRPILPTQTNTDMTESALIDIMRTCWEEDASIRPDISAVKTRFLAINKGARHNIMDNMIRMLEKYANNLEEIVNERTQQLSEEKKKTELLLYRMLPKSVADSLKTGKTVAPQLYKSATVYFSDIVSFTSLASESAPMEIIDFLNDLWTVFDDVIEKYKVYKVETIGDAYMVVSGLPDPYDNHAPEICNMSLEIMSSVMTFKIRHRPKKPLQVRIGLHTGPVATGVVGLTMPRYCLFGDTVNMASRMESTGQAQRIQISWETEGILRRAGGYHLCKRGEVAVKGKGMQTTYFLYGRDGYIRPLPEFNPSEVI